MKLKLPQLPEKLVPFKGVILFAIILMVSNYVWKFCITGDEESTIVTLFGWDISAPFTWMAHHVSHLATTLLLFLGYSVTVDEYNVLHHANGHSVQIIWACTGIKQMYICFCILAFARGDWRKKLWYVPLGILVVYLFNVFRITFIIACVEQHPEWFEFLHLYAFKYMFYGIIFLMWVYWEEKIVGKAKV